MQNRCFAPFLASVVLLCAGVASAQKPDIGSLQNARVAIETDGGKKELTFVAAPMPEEDLAALRDGTLSGAGLDVTDPEPLPADHPLWEMPNVIITPHVAARAALTSEQWKRLYHENLRRFAAGEPLLNVVDKQAGY